MTGATGREDIQDQDRTAGHWGPAATRVITIDGLLTETQRLALPLSIIVEYDEGEVVVADTHSHIHASGATEAAAIESFRRILAGHLTLLTSEEDYLGDHLREQLAYLRSAIVPVHIF